MSGLKISILALSVILVLFAGWCCFKIYNLSEEHAKIRNDYTTVNNITNGILSVDKWRETFLQVTTSQINNFDLSPSEQDTLKAEIEEMLHQVVNNVADTFLHEKKKTIGGKVKKAVANMIIDEDKIHDLVPGLAETVIEKALSEETKAKLKKITINKLNEFGYATYDSSANEEKMDSILHIYGYKNKKEFNAHIDSKSEALRYNTYLFTYLALSVVGIFMLLWWPVKKMKGIHNIFFIISIVLAVEVLIVGLTSQMIELDARIIQIDFHLVGIPISFENQVIFFRSKSIVDVVQLLIETGKYDSILVGILILLFSIVFPLSKLATGAIHLLGNEKLRKNKIVHFFAFNSGKWSMADVMVIAIFMAYIGFKGILDDQLSNLNIDSDMLHSISTNQTSLQPGYILFIGFVIFSLFLSVMLGKIKPAK